MAPRRGGGVSSGGSSDYSSGDNPWFDRQPLFGTHFHDGYIDANFAFTVIYTICLFAIAMWNCCISRRSDAARGVLRWNGFGVALFFTFISYLYNVIEIILTEIEAVVINVYFVISVIIDYTAYVGTIWLLATIYALGYHLFTQPDEKASSSKKKILYARYAVCGVLFALFLAILALGIRDVVLQVEGAGSSYLGFSRHTVPTFYKLDVAYSALVFVASLEILVGSIWGVVRSIGQDEKTPRMLFATLVALPFFIRRIFILAYNATFELSVTKNLSWGAYLAETIVIGLALIIVFAGIIMVVKKLEKNSPTGWNGGQLAQTQPNGYVQGFPHPQTVSYYPQNPPMQSFHPAQQQGYSPWQQAYPQPPQEGFPQDQSQAYGQGQPWQAHGQPSSTTQTASWQTPSSPTHSQPSAYGHAPENAPNGTVNELGEQRRAYEMNNEQRAHEMKS